MTDGFADLFVSASDGLRLYARDYAAHALHRRSVVCLPGLARTSWDFHELALALSTGPRPRRVLALDYRGRGRSEWDKDWRNYDVRVELDDTLQVLTAAGVEDAVFVGASRGGLIALGLSAIRPALLRGVVLNDVGPVIESGGLVRIRGYVGKLPNPRTYEEAADVVETVMGSQFPAFTRPQWLRMARGTWNGPDGDLSPAYDPNLMRTLDAIDIEKPLPVLWRLFEGVRSVPALAFRGEHSDLLSARTFEAMRQAHPRLEAITVPGQGHAPVLEGALVEAIDRFVEAGD